MKNNLHRATLTAALFCSLTTVCKGQSGTSVPGRTYDVDNTKIRVLIPTGMDVALTPQHLEADSGSAMFYYKLKVSGKEAPRMLHWNVYASRVGSEVDKGSWDEATEMKLGTEVERDAFLLCDIKPGAKLTVVLAEMAYDKGVRKIDEEALEQSLPQILDGRAALPETRFVAHADPSKEEEGALMKRSLKWILTKNEFRNDVKLSLPAMLLVDDPNAAPPLPDVQLISQQFVRERLRVGEPIRYLKYKGTAARGDRLTVYFQYHTPQIITDGTAYVPSGISITFTYLKNQSQCILNRVETEHF